MCMLFVSVYYVHACVCMFLCMHVCSCGVVVDLSLCLCSAVQCSVMSRREPTAVVLHLRDEFVVFFARVFFGLCHHHLFCVNRAMDRCASMNTKEWRTPAKWKILLNGNRIRKWGIKPLPGVFCTRCPTCSPPRLCSWCIAVRVAVDWAHEMILLWPRYSPFSLPLWICVSCPVRPSACLSIHLSVYFCTSMT